MNGVGVKLVRNYLFSLLECLEGVLGFLSMIVMFNQRYHGLSRLDMVGTSQSHAPLPVCFMNFHRGFPAWCLGSLAWNDAVFMFLYPKSSRTEMKEQTWITSIVFILLMMPSHSRSLFEPISLADEMTWTCGKPSVQKNEHDIILSSYETKRNEMKMDCWKWRNDSYIHRYLRHH